jgi:predicted molibdopterin-dependent oxidoreductase YjgC
MSFTTDVREGVQWPSLAEDDSKDAPKLALRFIEPVAVGSESYGFTLVAPRFLYDGGRLLAEAQVVEAHIHSPKILLSRPDAQQLGVVDGNEVTISQNGTSLALPVKVDRMLAEGMVMIPRNVADRPAEKLVGPDGLFATVKIEKS